MMPIDEAIKALDDMPPVTGTYWGDAIIACREAALATILSRSRRTAMDDGGPAFPAQLICSDGMGVERVRESYSGMTLRDWFAGQALAGIRSGGYLMDNRPLTSQEAVKLAFEDAEALLEKVRQYE